MLKFRKIIGVILVLTLLVCSFASCQKKKPEDVIDKADKALDNTKYVVDVTIEYSSDDENMKNAIGSFSKPSMKIRVDGDKFQGRMDLKLDGADNYIIYTYVDGVLYTEWCENGKTVQNSEALGSADKSALSESYGAGANVGINDFESVSIKSSGKVDIITCDKIKNDALNSLVNSLESEFALVGFDASVAIKDAKLEIEVNDGKYQSTTLTCLYFISEGENTYSVNMTYSCNFDYSVDFEITAPNVG